MMHLISDYKLLEPGTYDPHPHRVNVTAEMVKDFVDSVNVKRELGVPVTINYLHRPTSKVITVGRIRYARYDDGKAYADLEVLSDAKINGEVVATAEDIAYKLRERMFQGSMEAYQNYTSPAYTNGRKFGLWMVAWAVLPGGVQPAVPPRIAADEEGGELLSFLMNNQAPDGGESPEGKGASEMDEKVLKALEANTKSVEGLTTQFGELLTQLKGSGQGVVKAEAILPDATATETLKAAEDAVKNIVEAGLKNKPAGKREELLKYIMAGRDVGERMERFNFVNATVEDVKVETDPNKTLNNDPNGQKPDGGDSDSQLSAEEKAEKEAKADELAARKLMAEHPDTFGGDYGKAIAHVDRMKELRAEEEKSKK